MNKALRSLSKALLPRLNARENLGLWPLKVGTDRRKPECFPHNRVEEVRANQKGDNKPGSAKNSSIILASDLPASRQKLQVVDCHDFHQNVKIMHDSLH